MFIKAYKEQWPIVIKIFIEQNIPADRRQYLSIRILYHVIKLQTTPVFKKKRILTLKKNIKIIVIVSILLTQNKGENFYYPWEITQLSASYSDNLEFGNF